MRKILGKKCNGVNFMPGLFAILFLLTSVTFALAQGNKVSGTLKDLRGGPIVGAIVLVKGTTNGAVTDINGFYSIKYKDIDPTLVFSFMGFLKKEVKINGRTVVDDVLYDDEKQLNEVVIVGYGKQKKISVTGAVASVQNKELKLSSSPNLATALAGRLSGLAVLQTSGQPGYDEVKLYLRGASTVNGTDPLILIDGVPRSDLSSLDPNEVASVSILKDASATAVFGVRGANGVMIITTRRGSKGAKPEINVSTNYSMQSIFKTSGHIDSWEYAEMRNQAMKNDNWEVTLADEVLPFPKYRVDKLKEGGDYFYPNRNIWNEKLNKFAPQVRTNVNLSGGTENVQYFLNTSYLHQGSIIKTDNKEELGYDPSFRFDRYSFRANVDYKFSKYLKGFVNLSTYIEKANAPGGASSSISNEEMVYYVMARLNQELPYYPGPYPPNGSKDFSGREIPENYVVYQPDHPTSPYALIDRMGYVEQTRIILNNSVGLDLDMSFITKGLSSNFMFTYDTNPITSLFSTAGFKSVTAEVADAPGEVSYFRPIDISLPSPSMTLSRTQSSNYKMNLLYSINYSRIFNEKHEVTALANFTRDNWVNRTTSPDLYYNVIGTAARVTYGYDTRYLAEVNMGYNGSEQFAPTRRFGYFPAASVGWVISNENFMSSLSKKLITNLKLRASYGIVGNDQGVGRFLYLDNTSYQNLDVLGLNTGPSGFSSLGEGQRLLQLSIGNSNLGWETAKKQNYAIDVEFFGSLGLSFDYFVEKRDNILISRNTIPLLQGFPIENLPRVNMGKMDNKGFEFELSYKKVITRDFFFSARGNLAYNHNTVVFVDEPKRIGDYAYEYRQQGFPLATNWGYLINWNDNRGYFSDGDDIANYKNADGKHITYSGRAPRPGDFKYIDLNKDGVIDTKDVAPIGYPQIPELTFAFNISTSYHGFDFSMLLQGIGRCSDVYNWGVFDTDQGFYVEGLHQQAWTPESQQKGEAILYPALSYKGSSSQTSNSYFVQDRTYLRLKSMELGYTIPEKLIKRIGFKAIRVSVNGNNLFTWDKMLSPMNDPEVRASDSMRFPLVRTITFGLSATL